MSVEFTCIRCGKTFTKPPCHAARRSYKHCSAACRFGTADERFWSRVRKTPTCWEWVGVLDSAGYGRPIVNGRGIRAHRLSYEMAQGPIPDGMCVLHRCDNPACVRPGHLFLGTRGDNNTDRHKKGRTAHGISKGNSKLTEDDVREIRRRRAAGERPTVLAREYGVNQPSISNIVARRKWKHIE